MGNIAGVQTKKQIPIDTYILWSKIYLNKHYPDYFTLNYEKENVQLIIEGKHEEICYLNYSKKGKRLSGNHGKPSYFFYITWGLFAYLAFKTKGLIIAEGDDDDYLKPKKKDLRNLKRFILRMRKSKSSWDRDEANRMLKCVPKELLK